MSLEKCSCPRLNNVFFVFDSFALRLPVSSEFADQLHILANPRMCEFHCGSNVQAFKHFKSKQACNLKCYRYFFIIDYQMVTIEIWVVPLNLAGVPISPVEPRNLPEGAKNWEIRGSSNFRGTFEYLNIAPYYVIHLFEHFLRSRVFFLLSS